MKVMSKHPFAGTTVNLCDNHRHLRMWALRIWFDRSPIALTPKRILSLLWFLEAIREAAGNPGQVDWDKAVARLKEERNIPKDLKLSEKAMSFVLAHIFGFSEATTFEKIDSSMWHAEASTLDPGLALGFKATRRTVPRELVFYGFDRRFGNPLFLEF